MEIYMTSKYDTMSEAIALSSPSGKMSKRAKKRALQRLSKALDEAYGPIPERKPIIRKAEHYLSAAKNLREMAAKGFRPRAHIKEAERLESLARELSNVNHR